MLHVSSWLVDVAHLSVLREILELTADRLLVGDVQLRDNVHSIEQKGGEEDAKHDVDDDGNLASVEHPHEKERADVEEEQLGDEELEDLRALLLHRVDRFMHGHRALGAAQC